MNNNTFFKRYIKRMLLATKQLQHLAQLQRQCISPGSIKENTTDIHAIPYHVSLDCC